MSKQLAVHPKMEKLRSQEKQLRQGLSGPLEAARAMTVIHSEKLYEASGFKTFKEYLAAEWAFTESHASRLMDFATMNDDKLELSESEPPLLEYHSRTLQECVADDKQLKKAWKAVVEESTKHAKPITASFIRKVCEEKHIKAAPKQDRTKRSKKAGTNGHVNADVVSEVVATVAAHDTAATAEVTTESTEQTAQTNGEAPADATFAGRPSHGPTFKPEEFDPDLQPEKEVEYGQGKAIAPHLTAVLELNPQGRKILTDIIQIKKNMHQFCASVAGTWGNQQEFDRLLDQFSLQFKMTLYACNCPSCKNKPNKKCLRCEGRGWLDRAHADQNTDADKLWLTSQK